MVVGPDAILDAFMSLLLGSLRKLVKNTIVKVAVII